MSHIERPMSHCLNEGWCLVFVIYLLVSNSWVMGQRVMPEVGIAEIARVVPEAELEEVLDELEGEEGEGGGGGGGGGGGEEGEGLDENQASIQTQRDARAMVLGVPAPRGLILDRDGRPLAQNKVGYQVALDMTQISTISDPEKIVAWVREKVAQANELTDGDWQENEKRIVEYHRHRRWIPKAVSNTIFDERKADRIQEKLPIGLVLLPSYHRHYPERSLAAHIVGYVSTLQRLPTGPIGFNDPIFSSKQGKSGFEKVFDKELRGRAGQKKLLYDEKGNLREEVWIRRPRAGGTLVTTIDLDWQKRAEKVLRAGCERGALVVIDVNTGEVLAMASWPSFDLNDFIPRISHEKLENLTSNPANPFYARAFQAQYPPASTFKPVVTMAAVNNGVVNASTLIDCPYEIKIGQHWFRNHSKRPEGRINAARALARSCNPWFYQVGIKTGPESFLSLARRLGFGSKTGLPLINEAEGLIPTHDYMIQTHGRRMTDGDTANLSIGQGVMLASPLQVAQAMAGIANGGALPKLRLVRQIQDFHGRVVKAPMPEKRNDLNVSSKAISVTHRGMVDVVHARYGTGKKAYLPFTVMAGKTGTAQWGAASENQRLAWFAGFFPLENPRFAYAVLYEGKPHQSVSGGKFAAPMVRNFFNPLKSEIKKKIVTPAKAMLVVEEEEVEFVPPRAIVVEDDEQDDVARPTEAPVQAIPEPESDAGVAPEIEGIPQIVPEVAPEAIPIEE